MENIILFGAGKHLNTIKNLIDIIDGFYIEEIWDNDNLKWGQSYLINKQIVSIVKPHISKGVPVIIVSPIYEREIRSQLIEEVGISQDQIKSSEYLFHRYKEQIVDLYRNTDDIEVLGILDYLKDNDLKVFNYSFIDEYKNISINLYYDEFSDMYYTLWKNHKMFLPKCLGNEGNIREYIRGILIEQDIQSPHCYDSFPIKISNKDVIIDAGGAEGFYTLERIDRIKKAYIVESDPNWIEALEYTFSPYKNKVEIINCSLGEYSDDYSTTIDELNIKDEVTLIKMDIEGAELSALRGATKTLKNKKARIIACTYHQRNDAKLIESLLTNNGFQVRYSPGYMFFPYGKEIVPELRRGLIFADYC